MIPTVTLVFVLTLGPDITDLFLHFEGRGKSLTAPAIAPRAVCHSRRRVRISGRGPDGSRDYLQQLSLARPVAAGEHPALPRLHGPTDIMQNVPSLPLERQVFEAH